MAYVIVAASSRQEVELFGTKNGNAYGSKKAAEKDKLQYEKRYTSLGFFVAEIRESQLGEIDAYV